MIQVAAHCQHCQNRLLHNTKKVAHLLDGRLDSSAVAYVTREDAHTRVERGRHHIEARHRRLAAREQLVHDVSAEEAAPADDQVRFRHWCTTSRGENEDRASHGRRAFYSRGLVRWRRMISACWPWTREPLRTRG